METINKGKAGQIGEIRTWAGKKYQKTAKGWRPVSSKGSSHLNEAPSNKVSVPLHPSMPESGRKTFYNRGRGSDAMSLKIEKKPWGGYDIRLRKGEDVYRAEDVAHLSEDELKKMTEIYRDRSTKEIKMDYNYRKSVVSLDRSTMDFKVYKGEDSVDKVPVYTIPGKLFKDYLSYLEESESKG